MRGLCVFSGESGERGTPPDPFMELRLCLRVGDATSAFVAAL